MGKTSKQYLVKFQFACDVEKGLWRNASMFDEELPIERRYYKTLSQAKAGLKRIMAKFNKNMAYDAKGERRETSCVGMIGMDTVYGKKWDMDHRVVSWSIQSREVTPWKVVQHKLQDEKAA